MLSPAPGTLHGALLHESGLRIGEALGLRRGDMHLLPDSRGWDARWWARMCMFATGPTLMGRWPSPGSRATVPASDAVLAAYADYQYERAEIVGDDGTDMVLVNLYHEPLGAPMTYRAAKVFSTGWPPTAVSRSDRTCCATPRPPTGCAPGSTSTLCRRCLGHASLASTTVYLHARDEDKRRAVEAVAAGEQYR